MPPAGLPVGSPRVNLPAAMPITGGGSSARRGAANSATGARWLVCRFFLWNPWWGDLIIVAYAVAANLPCIFAQRYNRSRLTRLLGRAGRTRDVAQHPGKDEFV